jgi:uncharacterized protein (DUF1810 family)
MEPNMIQPGDPVYRNDIWDLSRFIEAQQNTYDTVVSELRRGKKQGHWKLIRIRKKYSGHMFFF